MQLPGGQLIRSDVRSAEGPAAAKGEVEAEPEVTRSLGSEAEIGQEAIRAARGSDRRQRLDVCHLDPTETSVSDRPS